MSRATILEGIANHHHVPLDSVEFIAYTEPRHRPDQKRLFVLIPVDFDNNLAFLEAMGVIVMRYERDASLPGYTIMEAKCPRWEAAA